MDGFVACDKFQPTVLEGQMCYSLDLQKLGVGTSKTGKQNGLMLVLDSLSLPYGLMEGNTNKGMTENISEPRSSRGEGHVARIILDTLSPFTDYRNGSYAMSSLKKMSVTPGFLKLLESDKKCAVEKAEVCNGRKYLERVHSDCQCVLWALGETKEVCYVKWFYNYCRTFPTAPLHRPPVSNQCH